MIKYLFFFCIFIAASPLEALPMRVGEVDSSDPDVKKGEERQRGESVFREETTDFSYSIADDNMAGDNNSSLTQESNPALGYLEEGLQNNITSKLEDSLKEIELVWNKPDVSRLFVPSISERIWSEYFQQSWLEARSHERAVAVLEEVNATMRGMLEHAHRQNRESYKIIKQYKNSKSVLADETMRNELESAILQAHQRAQQLAIAKDPSAYVFCLANAIDRMLENSKVSDSPQLNEDGTYRNVAYSDQWELEKKLSIITPSKLPEMVAAAKSALPAVEKLSHYCQEQPVNRTQTFLIGQISKFTKGLKAVADLSDH